MSRIENSMTKFASSLSTVISAMGEGIDATSDYFYFFAGEGSDFPTMQDEYGEVSYR